MSHQLAMELGPLGDLDATFCYDSEHRSATINGQLCQEVVASHRNWHCRARSATNSTSRYCYSAVMSFRSWKRLQRTEVVRMLRATSLDLRSESLLVPRTWRNLTYHEETEWP